MALPALTPGDQRDWALPRFSPQSSTYSLSTPAFAAPIPKPITAATATLSATSALPVTGALPGQRLYRAHGPRTTSGTGASAPPLAVRSPRRPRLAANPRRRARGRRSGRRRASAAGIRLRRLCAPLADDRGVHRPADRP